MNPFDEIAVEEVSSIETFYLRQYNFKMDYFAVNNRMVDDIVIVVFLRANL